jgi:GntR family transcriptional repressor for pyruvate dehydrogenase complex
VKKESLVNKLVREILARVFAAEYPVESRLPSERLLSEEFKTSRGTVRQALGILAELGVIEIRHGSGAYVQEFLELGIPTIYLPPEITTVSLEEILDARKAIETVAGELACGNASASDLKKLDRLTATMEQEIDDLPMFLKHDMAFHETIVRAGGNRPLIKAFESIREYLRYFQVFTSRHSGDERRAIGHHRKIVDALRSRDPKATSRAIRRHLDSVGTKSRQQKLKKEKDQIEHGWLKIKRA